MRRLLDFSRENWLSLLLLAPFTAVVLALIGGGIFSWVDSWDLGDDSSQISFEDDPGEDFCTDGIGWTSAEEHVGETVSVFGTVERVSQPAGVTGDPTFIEIGNAYPNPARVNAVIWGQDSASFESDLETEFGGETVCVTGEIEAYNGVPQITIRDPSQIVVDGDLTEEESVSEDDCCSYDEYEDWGDYEEEPPDMPDDYGPGPY